jgi:hypothetical protein
MAFIKATKKQSKLRLALFGTSGSGKTYTALRIAKGIGGKVAVIDSERGSASKYSDRFDFDVNELSPANIDNVINSISEAQELGYNVLIIDSLTHSWQELLEEIDKLANAKYRGNSWQAWNEGTPKQKKLINAILNFNGHIIATMRSKTEWTTETGSNGRMKPVRVGLAPEGGKNIEYEFDMLIEISPDHIANVIKDRTGMFQDKLIEKPDEKFGKQIFDWLNSGSAEKVEYKEVKTEIKNETEPDKIEPAAEPAPVSENVDEYVIKMLKSEMATYELPDVATENLEREISRGKLNQARVDIWRNNLTRFPKKKDQFATKKEIQTLLDIYSRKIDTDADLRTKMSELNEKSKIEKGVYQNYLEEVNKLQDKLPEDYNPLTDDSSNFDPETIGDLFAPSEPEGLPLGVI